VSAWSRWLSSIRESFEIPSWAPVAAGVCVLVVAIVGLWDSSPQVPSAVEQPAMAEAIEEPEAVIPGKTINLAWVSGVDVKRGFVIIDQLQDDPTQPVIVWHIDDEADQRKEADG